MRQQTIGSSFSFSGKGLHTGQEVNVEVTPSDVDTGIVFVHAHSGVEVKAHITSRDSTVRSTSIRKDDFSVHTIEHLMSALWTLGVDNATVRIDGNEVPILDGSAKTFVQYITQVGIVEQDKDRDCFQPMEVITFHDEETGAHYELIPHDGFEADVMIEYGFEDIGFQHAHYKGGMDYASEIASCRTYVLLSELEQLAKIGLIKGGDIENAVVFADRFLEEDQLNRLAHTIEKTPFRYTELGPINTQLLFSNEPARHKLLDMLGDLALLGVRLKAKVIARKPGHTSNLRLVNELYKLYKEQKIKPKIPHYDPSTRPIMTTMDITAMLPHRFPFLLVDKVIEIGDNHIVGVKSVTFNEHFFQGHFPGNPVMPGVLIIEALAQVGGVLALSKQEVPEDWDTYFLKMEDTKFRKKVVPGDTLLLRMEFIRPIRRGICEMRATAFVGDSIVAEGDLTAKIINRTLL